MIFQILIFYIVYICIPYFAWLIQIVNSLVAPNF